MILAVMPFLLPFLGGGCVAVGLISGLEDSILAY